MIEDSWHNLYNGSWKNLIRPQAFSHPAKYSRKLIEFIYNHAIEEGWVTAGDTILDPFGGVALGGLDAMKHGLVWVGCELEERFCLLGRENIALWNKRYSVMPGWGSATLLQGDSRKLIEVIQNADLNISSPPYAETRISENGEGGNMADMRRTRDSEKRRYGSTPGQLGSMSEGDYQLSVSSPPFLQQSGGTNVTSETGPLSDPRLIKRHSAGNAAANAYGESDSNLGNMPQGNLELSISSPPYADIAQSGGTKGLKEHGTGLTGNEACFSEYGDNPAQLGKMESTEESFTISVSSPPFSEPNNQPCIGQGVRKDLESIGKNPTARYGSSEGNLGNMDMGISSPPFMDNNVNIGSVGDTPAMRQQINNAIPRDNSYGVTNGQLGNENANDFWSAARLIIEQVYQVLKPGGHAVWVTKRYIKNHKIVDFTQQWVMLCEAVGFQTIHRHKAWLVEDRGTQYDLFGNGHKKEKKRYSFFRRLHAKKYPELEIQWEDVICMVKPE